MKFTVTVSSWAGDEGDTAFLPSVALVASWAKEIGDRIEAGETLAYLQTNDGGEVAVVSPAFGIVARKFALPGEAIEAGEPIATLAGVPGSVLPAPAPPPDPFAHAPAYVAHGPEEAVVWSPVEERYAQTLTRARQVAPHVTTVACADVSEAVRFALKSGASLSDGSHLLLPFVVSAAAATLLRFPVLNAQLIAPNEIRRKRYVRIAFPVYATDDGDNGDLLALPVIADADRKSVLTLAREIAHAARRARSEDPAPLAEGEQTGATFTVSPSAHDVLYQTPAIHLPQSAHLAFGPPRRVPVALDNETITTRFQIYLCLSHDARLINDRAASQFLSEVKAHLEESRFLFA